MPESPYSPTPSHAHALFTAVDALGAEVSLRRPEPGEFLCGPCLSSLLCELAELAEPELTEALREAFAAVEDDPDQVGFAAQVGSGSDAGLGMLDAGTDAPDQQERTLTALYPPTGQPGHDCTATAIGPMWLLRQHDCSRDLRDHLRDGSGCRCGALSLLEALEHLSPEQGQGALEAHVAAMNAGYDHLIAAEILSEDNPTASVAYLPAACVTCMADPAFHADEIDDDLVARTLDLTSVLRAYDVHLTLGPRRGPGPMPAAGTP